MQFSVKYAKNVCEMSPSGKINLLIQPLKKLLWFKLQFYGKSPLLKSGKYVIGEFEPIVSFCNIKVRFDKSKKKVSKLNFNFKKEFDSA